MLLADAFGQVLGGAFGDPSLIDEDQRRLVVGHELGEPVVDFLPDLVGHHRCQWRVRNLQRQITLTNMPRIDDLDVVTVRGSRPAHQKIRHRRQWLDRGRQTDTHRLAGAQRRQAFQRQHQMCAALAPRDRVQFVHDDRAQCAEHAPAAVRGQQDVQRLRRRDQNMRRIAAHPVAFGLRRVAGAHAIADRDIRVAQRSQVRADAGQRLLQILLNVVGQRLER